jgi:hypothetical protein
MMSFLTIGVVLVAPLAASAGALSESTGTVHVVVVDDADVPAARLPFVNLVVTNAFDGEVVMRQTTGEDGTVDLSGLPFGRYIVLAVGGEYSRRDWREGLLRPADRDDTDGYCDSISSVVGVTPVVTHAAVEIPMSGCGGGAAAWFAALGPQGGTAGYLGALVGIPVLGYTPIPNTR